MARKKAQRKQETTLVPHRTPNLSILQERAKTGESADAVRAYLDAGGTPMARVQIKDALNRHEVPLLHSMALTNAHPHRELAESVGLLMAAGADINDKAADCEGDDRTALMCAAECSCCSTVSEVLLQAGADVSMHSSLNRMTALHIAAMARSAGCCELLLVRGSTLLESKDAHGWTALMYAGHRGCLNVAQLLLQHGAEINAVGIQGNNALMLAARASSIAVAQLLLDSGADLSARDCTGENVLFKAARAGNVPLMELLVQRGLSVTVVDNKGNTVLITAASAQQKAAAEWLIQRGVAVNAVNDSSAALHIVCTNSSVDDATMIELLLANAADVNQCAEGQLTALNVAASSGSVQCAEVLIAAGADVNHFHSVHMASLHTAIYYHQATVVQLLLEHGATAVMNSVIALKCSDDAPCCDGMTALMMCNEVDTVKLLLAAGADVHITNIAKDTCLHVAAKHNWKAPMICLLVKAGADLHAVNNEGQTAAQIAHDRGHTLIEQLLNRAPQQQGH
jgi:uncharacterized protein